jgi:hypothetical protein
LWGRDFIYGGGVGVNMANIHLTIHGHTPLKKIKLLDNSLFIDTGAHYTGNLSVIRIDDILKDDKYLEYSPQVLMG